MRRQQLQRDDLPASPRWLFDHIQWLATLSPFTSLPLLCLELAAAYLLPVIVTAALGLEVRSDLQSLSPEIVVGAVVLAPLLETALFQMLPIELGRICDRPKAGWLASWTLFAVVHFQVTASTGLAAGVAGGFFLTLAYVISHGRGRSIGFLYTSALHLLNNLVAVGIMALPEHLRQ